MDNNCVLDFFNHRLTCSMNPETAVTMHFFVTSDVYVCMHKHARLGGVWGHAPPGKF